MGDVTLQLTILKVEEGTPYLKNLGIPDPANVYLY